MKDNQRDKSRATIINSNFPSVKIRVLRDKIGVLVFIIVLVIIFIGFVPVFQQNNIPNVFLFLGVSFFVIAFLQIIWQLFGSYELTIQNSFLIKRKRIGTIAVKNSFNLSEISNVTCFKKNSISDKIHGYDRASTVTITRKELYTVKFEYKNRDIEVLSSLSYDESRLVMNFITTHQTKDLSKK